MLDFLCLSSYVCYRNHSTDKLINLIVAKGLVYFPPLLSSALSERERGRERSRHCCNASRVMEEEENHID